MNQKLLIEKVVDSLTDLKILLAGFDENKIVDPDADMLELHPRFSQVQQERDELLEACIQTVEENGHLADGENCTLIHLVRAITKVEGGAA